MKQKGYGENVPVGFLSYPISQAADILFCKGNLVPVGEDQLPVIEQANEIALKFNSLYGKVFPKIQPIVSESPRLLGLDGKAKASKSLGNTIFLDDKKEEIEKKVMSMFTDPDHIHVDQPGKVEGNMVFHYLDIFDKDKKELESLKKQYKTGGMGDLVIKKRLIKILEDLIGPIRKKKEELKKDKGKIEKILEEGSKKAGKVAKQTMKEVKEAIKIDYF